MLFVDRKKTEYTEEEVIWITKLYGGFNGSEFETVAWIRDKRLNMDRTQKGLMSKLETMAVFVELKTDDTGKPLKGRKRRYIIKDWKDEQTERPNNYKGTVNEEDEIIDEYIFNRLLLMYHKGERMQMTNNQWAISLGLDDPNEIDFAECEEVISELHKDTKYNRISKYDIVQLFKEKSYKRGTDTIKLSFKHLEDKRDINVIYHYHAFADKKKVTSITKERFDEIFESIKEKLKELKSSIQFYNKAKFTNKKRMNQIAIVDIMEEYLLEKFQIIDIFISTEVELLNTKQREDVGKMDFYDAYYNKFFKLIRDQQNSFEEANSGRLYMTNKFYQLHMLVLIESMGYETPRGAISEEIRKFDTRLQELKADVKEIEEAKVGTFGFFNVKEFPLSKIYNVN